MKEATCEEAVKQIIEQMKMIIGPVAITQANLVKGLSANKKVKITGEGYNIISQLVERYKLIMGQVALTIAKRSLKELLRKNPKLKVPEELR